MVFLQFGDHLAVSKISGILKFFQIMEKLRILPVDGKPEDMDISAIVVCGKFESRDQFDAVMLCSFQRFGNTCNRIVIGQCNGR